MGESRKEPHTLRLHLFGCKMFDNVKYSHVKYFFRKQNFKLLFSIVKCMTRSYLVFAIKFIVNH